LLKELSSFNSIEKNKKIDKKRFKNKLKRINVIGNPPFGKNASKAVRFFNQAALFARIIAFIVPRSFEKESIINRLNQNFHLIHVSQLPRNSFSFENIVVDVPCSFCVWVSSVIPLHHDDVVPSIALRPGPECFAFQPCTFGAGGLRFASYRCITLLSNVFFFVYVK
jgi:hypothetical protein